MVPIEATVGEAFLRMNGIPHPLKIIIALNIFLGIFEYRGPKTAHLQFFMPSIAVKKMTSIGFIMESLEDVVDLIFSNSSAT